MHMDSGLGNQMLDYVEYLAIRKMNPGKECYLENLIYELPHTWGISGQAGNHVRGRYLVGFVKCPKE